MTCTKQYTAKYAQRPGPPYPAQQCKGMIRLGNDDILYKSVPASNGVYRWMKVSSVYGKIARNHESQYKKRKSSTKSKKKTSSKKRKLRTRKTSSKSTGKRRKLASKRKTISKKRKSTIKRRK